MNLAEWNCHALALRRVTNDANFNWFQHLTYICYVNINWLLYLAFWKISSIIYVLLILPKLVIVPSRLILELKMTLSFRYVKNFGIFDFKTDCLQRWAWSLTKCRSHDKICSLWIKFFITCSHFRQD